ncbi:MAG: hypothetical protein Q8O40_00155 [Chloroflexota bacterium]|nr:hypothetical protein [Chloroflexota bacterium]
MPVETWKGALQWQATSRRYLLRIAVSVATMPLPARLVRTNSQSWACRRFLTPLAKWTMLTLVLAIGHPALAGDALSALAGPPTGVAGTLRIRPTAWHSPYAS